MKISRPVVYVTVLGVAAYAYVLVTQPDAAPTKKAKHSLGTTTKDQNGITAEDLKAHFARYVGQGRDTFIPKVVPKKGAVALAKIEGPTPGKLALGTGTWSLTGITVIDNSRSAVMENTSTHEIFFLKTGDHWNGMHVAAVDADSVVFVNAANQETRVHFAVPKAENAPVTASASLVPGPSAPQINFSPGPVAPPDGPSDRAQTNPTSPNNTAESVNPQ